MSITIKFTCYLLLPSLSGYPTPRYLRTGQRINDNTDYAGNRSELASTYQHALQAQNKFDLQLYRAVVQGIWQELQQSGLWRLREVRDYWHSRMQDTR